MQYPVGVYVIGLGQTGELNKGDLTTAVTKAVLDRCLRLYQHEGARHRTCPPMRGRIYESACRAS